VSDPWELGTACGTGPFLGRMVAVDETRLIIRLLTPIVYQGKELRTVLAQPRHEGDAPRAITAKAMPANLLLLPEDIAPGSSPTVAITRGGIAAIGAVEQYPRKHAPSPG